MKRMGFRGKAALLALSISTIMLPLSAAACDRAAAAISKDPAAPYGKQEAAPQYSARVILVSVDRKLTKKELKKLLKKYDLSVVYDYKNFNMYALSADRDLTDDEMQKLLDEIGKEKHVSSASRDEILTLDDEDGGETSTADTGYELQ